MNFTREELSRDFGRIWPVHVEHFAELLITLRRQFEGDLDRLLIMAIIGVRTLPPRRVEGRSFTEFQSGEIGAHPSVINVQSISDTTGIARETVRRKVAQLEAKGWVQRGEGGDLVVAPKARDDLAAGTEATMRYLVAVGAACVRAAAAGQR